jgi:flagellar hook-length control protein FliK
LKTVLEANQPGEGLSPDGLGLLQAITAPGQAPAEAGNSLPLSAPAARPGDAEAVLSQLPLPAMAAMHAGPAAAGAGQPAVAEMADKSFSPPLAAVLSRSGAAPRPSGMVTGAEISGRDVLADSIEKFRTATESIGQAMKSMPELRPSPSPAVPPAHALALAAGDALPAIAGDRPVAHATLSVPVPMHRPEWGEAVGERVLWMVNQRIQSAQLVLNPPELGPVDVQLKMHNGEASVVFVSPHASVREAIENSLPHLRELFAGAGARLADASVEHRQPGGRSEDSRPATNAPATEETATGTASVARNDGLIDLFA